MTSLPYSVAVRFIGSGIKSPYIAPKTITINQKEYNHDVVTMTFWGGDVNSDSLQSGVPMAITWGRPTIKRSFYGYVNHADRVNNYLGTAKGLLGRNSITITCVGASWPMKNKGNASFTNTTTAVVVAQIAAKYGLATDIVPDSTVWPSLKQAGLSDWEFCVKMAQQIGYTFYCNGIQLVYKPRSTNPNNLSALAAVFDMRANPGALPIFNPQVGATSPLGGQLANRRLGGINPRTNQAIFSSTSGSPAPTTLGASADDPVFDVVSHGATHSQSEADARTAGSGTLNQLYISASATASGSPLVSQGSIIYIQNANGAQNGLWFVQEAKHILNNMTYEMPMVLGRDSMGGTQSMAVKVQAKSPPAASIIGTTWVAA